MQKNLTNVGDFISPALDQNAKCIAISAGHTEGFCIDETPKVPSISRILSASRRLTHLGHAEPPGSCKQCLWFSFFFDGTGNNLEADIEMNKYSNVAKLFRAHRGDENIGGRVTKSGGSDFGVYRVYLPGVGTYFKDIRDPGGSTLGLGMGAMGDARINWAFVQLRKLLQPHLALANDPKRKIVEINVAAFGFSRGAALARAFISDLINTHCVEKGGLYFLGNVRLRVRFLGIFDTVASSGLAASANVMGKLRSTYADHVTHVEKRVEERESTRADVLAFAPSGRPGADPTPGFFDGHNAYGGRLLIPPMVEDVRHFVAGHENRNSFPLDSITVVRNGKEFFKPAHFHEYVFPGVHSDVGGSYSPGEGGKHRSRGRKLGLIPLKMMFDMAETAGVPLIPSSAWPQRVSQDFAADEQLITDFSYYQANLKPANNNLGAVFNAHMGRLFEWRFQSIRKKLFGDLTQRATIENNHSEIFQPNLELRDQECALRNSERLAAREAFYKARDLYQNATRSFMVPRGQILPNSGSMKLNMELRQVEYQLAIDNHLVALAKQGSAPNDKSLAGNIAFYDHLFMQNARDITLAINLPILNLVNLRHICTEGRLRPHYKMFMLAYRQEWDIDRNRRKQYGMRDARLISFFDDYVHDSLAAFAKDATFPSDPRVIYVGGDEKFAHG